METILKWLAGPLMDLITPCFKLAAALFNPALAVGLAAYELLQWISRTLTGSDIQVTGITASFTALKAATAGAVFGAFPPQIGNAIAFMNYMFPVTEALIMLGALSALYVLAVGFRIVKSWIPTVN